MCIVHAVELVIYFKDKKNVILDILLYIFQCYKIGIKGKVSLSSISFIKVSPKERVI